jgi:hypothetical protein
MNFASDLKQQGRGERDMANKSTWTLSMNLLVHSHSQGTFSRMLVLIVFAVMTFGCTTLERNPAPIDRQSAAQIAGMPGVRAWAGAVDPVFQQDIINSTRQEPPGLFPRTATGGVTYKALAISGGGENGAFGAGFLNAWTKTGTRPTFKIVTGISTGALIAPFGFLGPAQDNTLKALYTGISAKDIYKERGKLNALGHESFADTTPLAELIARYVDEAFLREIAAAHNQGRRLYIGTTVLDAERFVVWNMGAIAQFGNAQAVELFRKVMLASASVPIVFNPIYIDVEVDGKRYDEMHVDGGVKTQVFFYGAVLNLKRAGQAIGADPSFQQDAVIYILRNGKLGPEPEQVPRKLADIAGRTVSAMTKAAALGDLFRIYTFAQRDGIQYNYVGIPDDYEWVSDEEFDPVEMKKLYEVGYQLGSSAEPWKKGPPGLGTD